MKEHITAFNSTACYEFQVYQSDFADQDIKIDRKKYIGKCLNCKKTTRVKDHIDCPRCSHALHWSEDRASVSDEG